MEKSVEKTKEKTKNPVSLNDVEEVQPIERIFRQTLAFNKEAMLCHFKLLKNSKIPLHKHIHTQIGYVLVGKVNFFTEKDSFIAEPGSSYVFDGNEKHGAEILEDAEIIEVFCPCREEYK